MALVTNDPVPKYEHTRLMNEKDKEIEDLRIKLRDQFAMAALQGILHNPNDFDCYYSSAASTAYEYADEMLKARK